MCGCNKGAASGTNANVKYQVTSPSGAKLGTFDTIDAAKAEIRSAGGGSYKPVKA